MRLRRTMTPRLLPSGAACLALLCLAYLAWYAPVERTTRPTPPPVWALLLDDKCLTALSHKKPCVAPLKVAAFRVTNDPLLELTYILKNNSATNYLQYISVDENDVSVRIRATPRFNTTSHIISLADGEKTVVHVPDDVDEFKRLWSVSDFLQCKNLTYVREEMERTIPVEKFYLFEEYMEFARRWNTTIWLAYGTLLGWYRECDVIKHTHDIDFSVDGSLRSPAFFNAIQEAFPVRRVFGAVNSSLEFFWIKDEVRTDLFFRYAVNATHFSTSSIDFGGGRVIYQHYPKPTSVCTGDLQGYLVYVPCNAEQILRSLVIQTEYGNWTVDVTMDDFNYASSPLNIIYGPELPEEEFSKLSRSKWDE